MKLTFIPIMLMALTLLCGCRLPAPVAQAPEIRGVVIDKTKRTPIGGVLAYYKEYPRYGIRTDSNGQFLLREIKRWEMVSISKNLPYTSGTLVLESQRHETRELEIKGKGGWPEEITIELDKSE